MRLTSLGGRLLMIAVFAHNLEEACDRCTRLNRGQVEKLRLKVP